MPSPIVISHPIYNKKIRSVEIDATDFFIACKISSNACHQHLNESVKSSKSNQCGLQRFDFNPRPNFQVLNIIELAQALRCHTILTGHILK